MKKLLSVLTAFMLVGIMTVNANAWEGEVVSGARTSDHVIALTFDDGPHRTRTPEILDILAEYNVRATFFVIGENVKASPDIVKREIDEGHEIGNHTYYHTFLKGESDARLEKEINDFDDLMLELFEYKPKLIRPPGGLYDTNLCKMAHDTGYSVVLWSIDTRDWAHTPTDKICEEVCKKADSGDIILMHDFIGGKSPTPDALRTIIPYLLDKGFDFVTVSELMEEK